MASKMATAATDAARTFRKTSIKDVARRASVSTTTVSYFVNGRPEVCAPETAARIQAAIEELHYTPSSLTRGLRRGATHTIGVCLYSPFDPELRFGSSFFEHIWRGIAVGADAVDYSLLHYPQSVRNGQNNDALLDGRVDGVLLQSRENSRAEKLVRAGMPVVVLNQANDNPLGCGAVYADEDAAVTLALNHLRDLGHRRIAHLVGPARQQPDPYSATEEIDDVAVRRKDAYIRGMTAEKTFDPALIGYADSWQDDGNGRVLSLAIRWRSLPEPPTAVLCANDLLAVAFLETARRLDWRIPEDVSVVGMDDSMEAREAAVPLTSVAMPFAAIGREAVHCLLRLMEGAPFAACQMVLPVETLLVRDSTAPAC